MHVYEAAGSGTPPTYELVTCQSEAQKKEALTCSIVLLDTNGDRNLNNKHHVAFSET